MMMKKREREYIVCLGSRERERAKSFNQASVSIIMGFWCLICVCVCIYSEKSKHPQNGKGQNTGQNVDQYWEFIFDNSFPLFALNAIVTIRNLPVNHCVCTSVNILCIDFCLSRKILSIENVMVNIDFNHCVIDMHWNLFAQQ